MISILYTIPNFITAGSGQVMMNIIERLDRDRFAPAVCVEQRGGHLDRRVEELGLPFIEAPFTVPARPYLSLPVRARQAARSFRPHRFDLWHSFHYLDEYTEALIARFAGAAWIYTKKSMSWGSRGWLARSYLAKRIVADNSDMPEQFFHRPGLRRKVQVIQHGVPTDRFSPDVVRSGLRAELGLDADAILIGCSSHLLPVKGHLALIEAVARVERTHLALAGSPLDDLYVRSLHSRVEQLGIADRVTFLGKLQDIAAFLVELDVYVLPTLAAGRMEGFPLALLEAMACGRACVASDIPGAHEQIEEGTSGLLVPPDDVQALVEALEVMVSTPERRADFGEAARRRVVEHFSIDREVTRHEQLYAGLMARV
ncbi:MAG: glycosyltransferase [bacterium]|nr:glycosyltransferase [bacterium]